MHTQTTASFSKFRTHVNSAKSDFFLEHGIDFVFGRREGPYVWNQDESKRLINCHSNGGVFNLGHRHPEVISTLKESLDKVDIGNHHFVSEHRANLAEDLSNTLPNHKYRSIFGVSGGEAVDTAIKVARKSTGRTGIISAKGGYHGHTGLSLAAGDARYSDPFLSSNSHFEQVAFNDLHALQQSITHDTAAVILETIPATLGMPLPTKNYLQDVALLCKKNGSLLILDEVQTGLSRTGKFWGFEHYFNDDQINPDIIITAKGLSGGIYPITATVIKDELDEVFHDDPFSHISTYGGAELGCIVAQKVIEISRQESFLANVNTLSAAFANGLSTLPTQYPFLIAEIRQQGLMIGIRTHHADFGKLMMKTCYDAGLLCVYAGNDSSVLQFLPPLIIDTQTTEEILERLEHACRLAGDYIQNMLSNGEAL